MKNIPAIKSLSLSVLLGLAFAWAGCSGGSSGDRDNRGDFKVNLISNGFGTIYPYRIRQVDSFGNPTTEVLNIESDQVLVDNVTGNNGVLPVATFPPPGGSGPELPNGTAGNQFMHFQFSHKLDVESILSDLLANQTNSGLTGALSVLAYDALTEQSVVLEGRGFVNGITYYNEGGVLVQTQAVEGDGADGVQVVDPRAAGFPNYPGASSLVDKKSFTFIADSDNNLLTFESFPENVLLRLVVTAAVLDTDGQILEQEVCTATTVGVDTNPPEVLGYTTAGDPQNNQLQINPGSGQTGIDPRTTVQVRFNKPVQPGEVGAFFDPQQLTPPSGGLTLSVTAAAVTFEVIYHADPFNYGDLCNYVVTPAYSLPGLSDVDVTVQNTTINSLTGLLVGDAVTTEFRTSQGPGVINSPVAPEAIYIGVGGADPGVAVIDLNGFGQGTGDINNTRWPLNPNIGVTGVLPPLSEGTTNLDAGSGGTLTLVKDTNLNPLLLREPIIGEVTDIHIGAPLDLMFNNENINTNTTRANQINPVMALQMAGNTISQPPHPNPPKLKFPPDNPGQAIFGEEPTVTSSSGPPGNTFTGAPPCLNSPLNQLVQGNPFATTGGQVGTYGTAFMGGFVGPQPPPLSPPPPPPFCPYTARQQVGHFLYVLDRDNRQIVVVNSNRFTVLDTIQLSDPVSMTISPDMRRLGVSNFSSSTVSFIDIDPFSSTFHQVVAETRVEAGPTGIAWQPDGEDCLVVSTDANFLTVISASDFTVRRAVGGFLNAPIDLVVTERYVTTGNTSGVYYAYILNGNGTIAVFESGPDGVNGIGFNDIIGTVANAQFPRARAMYYDFLTQLGGVYVGHVDDQGLGQVSRLALTSTPFGQQQLNPSSGGFILPPTYRQKEWTVTQKIGGLTATTPVRDLLSGNSVIDLATDEMINFGGALGQTTPTNLAWVRTPYQHSGKHTLKNVQGAVQFAVVPKLLFIALSDVGKVDVFEIDTGARVTTVDVPGVRVVSSYWRQ
ncbi:MAG: hypothetical protein VYE77_03950 [Planctomycetota bacterium]|nr:hypothetical protein [Planctomycetota bacterium]